MARCTVDLDAYVVNPRPSRGVSVRLSTVRRAQGSAAASSRPCVATRRCALRPCRLARMKGIHLARPSAKPLQPHLIRPSFLAKTSRPSSSFLRHRRRVPRGRQTCLPRQPSAVQPLLSLPSTSRSTPRSSLLGNLATVAGSLCSGGRLPLRVAKGAAGCSAGRARHTYSTGWTRWCPTGTHPHPSASPPAAGVGPCAGKGMDAVIAIFSGCFV
jgi:hypothetical protein